MTAINEQIVTAFEDNNMTVEEIAEDFDMDVLSIKTVLLQCSTRYRKLARKEPELSFSQDEAIEMRNIMVQIAKYAEDPNLQFRAARYIYDDVKGRNDLDSGIKQVNINVMTFNEQMQKALAAANRTAQKAIDIATTKTLLPA